MIKVLLAGIDTLEVGYGVSEFRFEEAEIEELVSAKLNAGDRSQSSCPTKKIITFRGRQFVIKPFGTARHPFILENSDITLKLNPKARAGRAFPEIHVIFRSECLWRNGWEFAADNVGSWIRTWARVDHDKVARADLCADIAEPIPELTRTFEEIMCRAKNREEFVDKYIEMTKHVSGHLCTGYTFGKGGSISINIYNKTHEVLKSHKEWFYNLWRQSSPEIVGQGNNSWPEEVPVTRVEARLRRKFLKSMQVDTMTDLKNCQADLWRYITGDWMSIREPGKDRNRSRWAISKFWSIVRSALGIIGRLSGVTRIKQIKPRLLQLRTLGRGVLVSIGAYAVAALSSSGGNMPSGVYGRRFVRRELVRMLKSDYFDQDIEKRAVLFGARMF